MGSLSRGRRAQIAIAFKLAVNMSILKVRWKSVRNLLTYLGHKQTRAHKRTNVNENTTFSVVGGDQLRASVRPSRVPPTSEPWPPTLPKSRSVDNPRVVW